MPSIGLIGAGQSLGALTGYVTWRLVSRRGGRAAVLVPALLLSALAPAAFFAIHDQAIVVAVSVAAGFASAGSGLALFDELMRRIPMRLGVTFELDRPDDPEQRPDRRADPRRHALDRHRHPAGARRRLGRVPRGLRPVHARPAAASAPGGAPRATPGPSGILGR